ncbi:MAG TPA: hypothetical protein VHO25_01090 [Polyangiaceae bacterium]|nr:hypothetical protein [Polyangiaceae bacterium]
MFGLGRAARSRIVPYLLLALLCGATASPLLGMQKRDSFPISTYPMFARPRGKPTFHRFVAMLENGARETVPPDRVASAEVLQTKVIITRAVKRGKKAMRRLCEEVAPRLAHEEQFATARKLRLEEVQFDSIRYFTEAPDPVASKSLMQCSIPTEGRP